MSKTLQTSYAASQTGSVAPTVIGPDRGHKEVIYLGAGVAILAVALGVFWISTQDDTRTAPSASSFNSAPSLPPPPALLQPATEAIQPAPIVPTLPTQLKDSLHADVYFEFGRNGLSEEAKTHLRAHAAFLKQEADWGVIVQGYTDQQGSAAYNKALGQKRAEAVRAFLAGLGIPDTSMKVVSLGEEGALCQDHSSECQQLNRRVHLEFIKVGARHLMPPVPAETAAPESDTAVTDTLPMISPETVAPVDAIEPSAMLETTDDQSPTSEAAVETAGPATEENP